MTITTGQGQAGLTPIQIDGLHQMPYRLTLQNGEQDHLFIGNQDVTINNGFILEKGQLLQVIVNPLDVLYAVSTKTPHLFSWLRETL